MVCITSWPEKPIKFITTKYKRKKTTYYNLCHEDNILKY